MMIKLCFSTLGCHDKNIDEILTLANKYSIDAIEVRGIDNELSNDKIEAFKDENIPSTLSKLNENHVELYILGTSCKFHDDEKREFMIEKTHQEILLAEKLGFKGIRVFGNLIIGNKKQCIKNVGISINKVCKFAKDHNIKVFLEVHGDFNTVAILNQLIEHIEYKDSFALIWDVYHTHEIYGKNWVEFYEAMKSYIEHVHIKDCINKQFVLCGEGEIEITSIMNYLVNDGYKGYFSLEWERKWNPELCELDVALKHLYNLLKMTY